jgi:hypothetical protein
VQARRGHVSGALYHIPIIKYDGGVLVQADFPGMDHLTISAGNLRLFPGPVRQLNDLLSLQGGLLQTIGDNLSIGGEVQGKVLSFGEDDGACHCMD